jgi:hypothetical protein
MVRKCQLTNISAYTYKLLDGYKICDVVLIKETKPERYCFERLELF